MLPFRYDHHAFTRYSDEQVDKVLNIAIVLRLLMKQPMTVGQLSNQINTPETIERRGAKYDMYTFVEKLEDWNYVQREKNIEKYKSAQVFCILTEAGKELAQVMYLYLQRGELRYNQIYKDYQNDGLAGKVS